MLWNGEERVYERIAQTYALMTLDRKGAVEAEFVRHGRRHLLAL